MLAIRKSQCNVAVFIARRRPVSFGPVMVRRDDMRAARSRGSLVWRGAGFAALLAVLLAGCGLPWPFPQPTPDPRLPDAQQVLRPLTSGANAGEIDTLDPGQIQFGSDYGMAQLIFPQLVTLDEKQQPVDWAAESHTISADGLTYTFHLHKGMAWSDGTAIDATIFAYSINRALDPCLGSGVSYYLFDLAGAETFNKGTCPSGAIKSTATLIGSSVQTPDPLTLRLTLTHPAGYFLSALTYPTSWAVPQTLVEKYTTRDPYYGTKSTWTNHLLDNGPFGGNLYSLTSWQHTQNSPTGHGSLTFDRNERFWGRKPLLRRIEYTLYKDVAVEWSDFTQGKGDVSNFPSAQLAEARALKGATVFDTAALSLSYLAPNWRIAPFDDVRVRQAFSLALDRNALGPQALRAFRHPTIHFVPEGLPGYNPDLTDVIGRKGKDALTPDLAAARKLASAYAAEVCAGDFAKCPPVTYTVPSGSSTQMDLAQAIVTQWRQAFPGWVILIGGSRASGQLKTFPEYQLVWNGWGADYPDPQDFLSLLWTTKAPYNPQHVNVPQADALLSQADGMSDQTARISFYQQAEQLLVNQAAAIPLYQQVYFYSLRSHVVGWRIAPTLITPLSVWQSAYIKR
jgi:peptide/nickel transport system substrate-binding protein/oligopeptide transport system substrate-binding protein